ncbi:hypothetical protein CEXT_419231 [Caerostris extrusa]|uniref:Uncharacterized protein n=1 Tax=Caerostris extrusa TaxID=172846 RepID=A0AAV4RR50_CAEEX|nr:hypothetical protein CEXT_419231 [Caerostris extrusa]
MGRENQSKGRHCKRFPLSSPSLPPLPRVRHHPGIKKKKKIIIPSQGHMGCAQTLRCVSNPKNKTFPANYSLVPRSKGQVKRLFAADEGGDGEESEKLIPLRSCLRVFNFSNRKRFRFCKARLKTINKVRLQITYKIIDCFNYNLNCSLNDML